jgi:ATP-dependent Clp protease adapter protein ClpS
MNAIDFLDGAKARHVPHQQGVCVIAVYTRDVAETKAKEATDLGRSNGYPLFFATEPKEYGEAVLH